MKNKILFVCLGNICRSPAAEAVFINQITKKGIKEHFKVDSAGTGGWHVGNEADARMKNAAFKRGIDIQSVARQINLQDFQMFDLILTMDNSNLEDVTSLSKEIMHEKKSEISPLLTYASKTNMIEVPDPYYGGERGFDNVLDLLEDAIEGLILSFNLEN